MGWTSRNCPQRFNLLSPRVREKAINIGNALMQSNIPAAHAERIAYERAVDWAHRNPQSKTPLSMNYVIRPHYGEWAVFYAGCEEPEYKFPTQDAAIKQALAMAQWRRVDVVIYGADGRFTEHKSFA